MAKAAEAFRTISEVAEELELQKHVLRFWEVKFPQIKPMKRGGGRRYYRPADMELLRGIRHLLHAEGYTIKGVQKILRDRGVDVVKRFGAEVTAGANASGGSAPASAVDDRASAAYPRPESSPAAPRESASRAASGSERSSTNDAQVSMQEPAAGASPNGTAHVRDITKAIAELKACRAILLGKAQASDAAQAGSRKRTMRATG